MEGMLGDTLFGEERRSGVLGFVNAVRKYAINSNADMKYIEELDALQQRIEGANVLETYFADFGIKEHREAEAIFQKIRVTVKQKFRNRDLRIKRRFQASVIPVGLGLFYLYYFMAHHAKLFPADLVHEVACVFLGILISTVFFIFDTLTLYFIDKRVSSQEEWGFIKQLSIILIIANIIFLPYYLAVQFYSTNLYLFLSPYLVSLVQGAIKLDVGSLFTAISLVLGDLAALFATWDFIQKRFRKLKNDILLEEHEGVNG